MILHIILYIVLYIIISFFLASPAAAEPLKVFGGSCSPLAFLRATPRRRGTPTAAPQFNLGAAFYLR